MGRRSASLERLVPDNVRTDEVIGRETLLLHLARYEFAARHVRPGRLLDIACGVGYGTRLLADQSNAIPLAVGVDISSSAIEYARSRYGSGRVHFRQEDAMKFHDADGFDTIVSLETIEHLPDPGMFLTHLVRQMRPGAILIGSVPVTPAMDANPYHLHDFTERSFRGLFRDRGLVELACFRQVQPFHLTALFGRKESRLKELRRNLLLYYLAHPVGFAKRVWSTLRHGLRNHYITVAWQDRGKTDIQVDRD
jgi:SAM-dependent methyltransferase